jgi:hypothetical protein
MEHKIYLNFWQVNTSQPEASSAPQFLGSLSFTQKPLFCVIMNDKWIGVKFDLDRCVLVLRKTELFSSNPNQIADEFKLASSLPPVDSWRQVKMTKSGFPQDMRLEPVNSDLLAVQVQETLQLSPPGVVRILNLATGDIVHQISLGTDFLPISWCGDNLIFLTKPLRQEGFDQEETFQLATFDPSKRRILSQRRYKVLLSVPVIPVEKLEQEAWYFLRGPSVRFPGANHLSLRTFRPEFSHADYHGIVLVRDPSVFIASLQ